MMHDVHMDHLSLTSHFSPAELSALKLDGALDHSLKFWDEMEDWRTRSFLILHMEKHPVVLTGLSALWAFGLSTEPDKHVASTVTASRIRRSQRPGLAIEERTLTTSDIWMNGTVGVTSPLRTITDLLRTSHLNTKVVQKHCLALMTSFEITQSEVMRTLTEMVLVPHKRIALVRAQALAL